jgi:hypothetical protein
MIAFFITASFYPSSVNGVSTTPPLKQLSPSTPTFTAMQRGLLSGIDDITKSESYSTNISFEDVAAMFADRSYIYRSALEDVRVSNATLQSYLNRTVSNAAAWIASNEVYDRQLLLDHFNDVVNIPFKFE